MVTSPASTAEPEAQAGYDDTAAARLDASFFVGGVVDRSDVFTKPLVDPAVTGCQPLALSPFAVTCEPAESVVSAFDNVVG